MSEINIQPISTENGEINQTPLVEEPQIEQAEQPTITFTPPEISNECYYMISNTILSQACNEYAKSFKDYVVPFSFIQFYIKELSSYNQYFTQEISGFMYKFFTNPSKELSEIATIFKKAFPTYATKTIKRGKISYIVLNQRNLDMVISYEITSGDQILLNSKQQLDKMLEHYRSNDELFSLKDLYTNYLRQEELQALAKKFAQKHKKEQPKKKEVVEIKKKDGVSKYEGRETAVIKEVGKVYQIRVPKFALPLKYPMSRTKCLLHRSIALVNLIDASRTIEFVNLHKITKIRENQHFIDKRKRLLTPQKSKYASFLDNF